MFHSVTKKTCMCCEKQTDNIIVFHKTRRQTHGLCYDCCHAYISPKIELLFNLLRQELPISNTHIDCCGSVNGELRNQCKVKFNVLDISCDDVEFPLYDDLVKLKYLLSDTNLKLCQNKECGSIIEITYANYLNTEICCPLCNIYWCRVCLRQPYHFGKTCIQVELEENESEYAQTINKKIADGLLKKCPHCQVPTEKERDDEGNFVGCNKITCTQCGIKWCWLCNDTNIDYNHFNENNTTGCSNRLWEGVVL